MATDMATDMHVRVARSRPPSPTATWLRRFLIVLTVLGLIGIAAVAFWLVGLIAGPLTMLFLSALFAYILYPAVARLRRHMPHWAAVIIVLLALAAALAVVLFGIFETVVRQITGLVGTITSAVRPQQAQHLSSLLGPLGSYLSPASVSISGQQLAAAFHSFADRLLGLTGSVLVLALVFLIVVTLSIYFLAAGPRAITWVRERAPLRWRGRINFFLDTADSVLGGFLRGAVTLACIMGMLTATGALVLGIPTWLLIGVIVFVCEFIPVFGAYISGTIGTLLALTAGWQVALIYLAYATVLQGFVDAHILIPRIIGKHTGVHPIISTFALLAGFSLFGILGAVFAIPVIAVAQILVAAAWKTYQHNHPEEFGAPSAEPPAASASAPLSAPAPRTARGSASVAALPPRTAPADTAPA